MNKPSIFLTGIILLLIGWSYIFNNSLEYQIVGIFLLIMSLPVLVEFFKNLLALTKKGMAKTKKIMTEGRDYPINED